MQRDAPHLSHLPLSDQLESMIRVNQAGEYGAKRIYQGQLATLRDRDARTLVQHMATQEQEHLDYFDQLLVARKIRPTALHPVWHVGGFLLGAVTGALGKEAAMACTVAVESVIDEHYRKQEEILKESGAEPELLASVTRFRSEEKEHHDTGLAHGAEQATAYPLLSATVRGITSLAIRLSERI